MTEPIFGTENGLETLSSRLLKKRTILAFGKLDEKAAGNIISSLLYLEDLDAGKPITLYIHSEGGSETEILGIFDVMRAIRCPVETVCIGKAHGLSALLLAGGEKGKRKAYANSEIMLSQVSRDKTFGQASDIELETEHLLETKRRVTALLAQLCEKDPEQVRTDMERKYWLFAEQAREYGLIDQIIS